MNEWRGEGCAELGGEGGSVGSRLAVSDGEKHALEGVSVVQLWFSRQRWVEVKASFWAM